MEDPYCEMPAGLTGIVDSVDDLGHNAEFSIMLLFIKKTFLLSIIF